jgi:hypothetical protein
MSSFRLSLKLLSDHESVLDEVARNEGVSRKNRSLLVSILLSFAIYGIIIGSSHSFGQSLLAGLKLPILFLLTLVICYPTLYVFNCLIGSDLRLRQYAFLLLGSVAVMGVLLLAFAPITLFFLLTTDHYQFFKILNVAILAVCGFFGVRALYAGMLFLTKDDKKTLPLRKKLLVFWILLFAFVGCQLAWTIRPFFGSPGTPVEFIRDLQGNFYSDIIAAIGEILGFH